MFAICPFGRRALLICRQINIGKKTSRMIDKYIIIRSSRKTLGLQVKEDGQIMVRAPYRVSKRQIDLFVQSHEAWIRNAQNKIAQVQENRNSITEQQRREGVEKALELIPQRVAYFAERMRVSYGRITIREQKTRWGSCSSKGNLNFNWKLVLVPPELLDYVVVHELAHRIEMNHSQQFWTVVEHEMPDYRERRKRLKEYRL